MRHIITRDHTTKPGKGSLATEITHLHYTWGVYLTLPDESLLLLQTSHSTSSDLLRKRFSGRQVRCGLEGRDQVPAPAPGRPGRYGQAETIARTVGIIIANALGVHLVKTQVDDAALP